MNTSDVCVIGSGAGGAPIAARCAEQGLSVTILERGPRYTRKDFLYADELYACRRDKFIPGGEDAIREIAYGSAPYRMQPHLWTGTCVGGGTVRMYGLYFRMKRDDFMPFSRYGHIAGAALCDWPIGLDTLQRYYDDVEYEIGVSGAQRPAGEKPGRYPQPPLKENAFAARFDRAAAQGIVSCFCTPRAVLSRDRDDGRMGCCYTGMCGSYGCSNDAKSSTLVTYIPRALSSGTCTLETGAYVYRLEADRDTVQRVCYYDAQGKRRTLRAGVVICAAGAIETARLLLNSACAAHPKGLANSSGQVGRNLTFRMPCEVSAAFDRHDLPEGHLLHSPHIQRSTQDLYYLPDKGLAFAQGGMISFLYAHPNPIERAIRLSCTDQGRRRWGPDLVRVLREWSRRVHVISDTFIPSLPCPDTVMSLSAHKDSHGIPVAKVSVRPHSAVLAVARTMAYELARIYHAMGAHSAHMANSPFTAGECQAGTCRMGADPGAAVVRPDCRSHDVQNLYITDASWFPTGIPVPPVATIMANALRVADILLSKPERCDDDNRSARMSALRSEGEST
jgi:choline dehydrogenase-like flavoprotein